MSDFARMAQTGFIVACVFLAGMVVYVATHEATHLALSDKPIGICIGYCETTASPVGWGIATANAEHNQQSRNERIPEATGLIAATAFAITAAYALDKTMGGKTKNE